MQIEAITSNDYVNLSCLYSISKYKCEIIDLCGIDNQRYGEKLLLSIQSDFQIECKIGI